MKILFLCGCLKPGRDGVGDYTRRLAGECIRQGHATQIVALNEKVAGVAGCETNGLINAWELQDDYGTPVQVWRWSNELSWRQRGKALMKLVQRERPDVVSVQFVPYAFHSKGLPFGFVRMLQRVAKSVEVRWQVMFHELWISRRHSRLGGLIGPVQKYLCLALVKVLPAPVIHTHMTGYLKTLRNLGLAPKRLPLYGNIPVFPNARLDPAHAQRIGEANVILYFGTITPRLESLRSKMQALYEEFKTSGADVHFVSIGSAGPHREAAEAIALETFGHEKAHFVGTVSADQVSAWMQRAQVGLSRSPLAIYEKSGSTAAMLEHGLDVRLLDDQVHAQSGWDKIKLSSLPSLENSTRLFLQSFERA